MERDRRSGNHQYRVKQGLKVQPNLHPGKINKDLLAGILLAKVTRNNWDRLERT